MGKVIKWLFGILFILILLVAAAAVILPMVIDPNDYKSQIVATAKEKLGRDLVIEQGLNLSVFPWLGIETGGVRVGNAEGFKAENFAEIEKLGLKVKLFPLLSRQVEVDTLVLDGLRLNLEKDASGKTNWDDLAGKDDAARSEDKQAGAGEGEGKDGQVSLSVQGVQIEDARVSWDDRQTGQTYVLDKVRLVTGAIQPGSSVPVEGGVTFSSNKPAMTLKANLGATVSSDSALAVFDVAGLVLELDAEGEGLPQGGAKLRLQADVVADTQADTLKVDKLQISGPAMEAAGALTVNAMQTNPAAKGNLSIAETNPKILASMFAAPIETTDPAALTRVSGDMDFSYVKGELKLDPLNIKLDDSTLSGYLHVPSMTGPVVRTKMELDLIDVDRYMPPAAAQDKTTAQTKGEPQGEQAGGSPKASSEDPFGALRTLDLVGEFKIDKLTINNARLTFVTTKIVSKGGVLTVDPMNADLYGGKSSGRASLDVRGQKPKLAAKNSLTGIQVGPLLKDVAGEDRLVGRGELNVDIRATGLTEADVRSSLSGTSRFAFKDGAVKGVNIAKVIREASGRLGLGADKLDVGSSGNQTDFSELSASLNMNNGVIKNDDLTAKSPLLRVEGKGEVDLPRDTVDYLVVTELVGSLAGQGGKSRSELAGVPIPVRVSGPLTDPKYRPDLEAALSAKAKAQLEEKKVELKAKAKEKIEEKVQDKLKGDVGDALKGLFK